MKSPFRLPAIAGLSLLALSTSLPAAVWVGGNNDNDWNTGANWDPVGVPNGVIADIASGTAVLSTPALSTIDRLRIASGSGSTGTVTISSTLTSTSTTFTDIARSGTGALYINTGANFQMNGGVGSSYRFGAVTGGHGTGVQTGGSVSTTGGFFVGVNGTGVYTISGGAITAAQNFSIANGAGSSGTYTQSSGTVTIGSSGAGGAMFVGQNGTGALNLSGGRLVGGTLTVGSGGTGLGTVNQTGGTVDLVNGPNAGATGQLAVTQGSYTVSGGQVLAKGMTISDDLVVVGNDATLTVQDAFSLTATGNITFTFNDEGITALMIGGVASFEAASIINIDGSAYAGTNGTFNLIDAASFNANTPTVNLSGFAPGSSYNWDAANGVLSVTVVPEPSTVALAMGGGALLILAWRRRRA